MFQLVGYVVERKNVFPAHVRRFIILRKDAL